MGKWNLKFHFRKQSPALFRVDIVKSECDNFMEYVYLKHGLNIFMYAFKGEAYYATIFRKI